MIRLASVLILLLCYTVSGFAQKRIGIKEYSHQTLIYKLKPEEAYQIYANDKFHFTTELCHTLVDSFPSSKPYTKKLPPGYYVAVHASEQALHYQLITSSNLVIRPISNGRHMAIVIHGRYDDRSITDAKVTYRNTEIPFDQQTHSYSLHKKFKHGILVIEAEGETLFFDVNKRTHKPRKVGKDPNHQGYIALNQPKYLPGDSVKVKAFLLGRHGKAYEKDVVIRILEGNYWSSKILYQATLKNDSHGAFTHSIPLNDSLKIDTRYRIKIIHGKHSSKTNAPRLLESSFYLEDYQLDETTYKVWTGSDQYVRADTVQVFAEGKDMNGLPVLDGWLHIKIKPTSIYAIGAREAHIPLEIYEQQKQLNPSGLTVFKIPGTLFPQGHLEYEIEATFRNSSNEIHREYSDIEIIEESKLISLEDRGTELFVTYLENGKEVTRSGRMFAVNKLNDTLFTDKVNFPHKQQVNAWVYRYIFECEDISKSHKISGSLLSFTQYRTLDSVFIAIENPLGIDVHYTLLKEEEILEQKVSKTLNLKIADPELNLYSIVYQYLWQGQSISEKFNIRRKENVLNITVDQPDEIAPGQKATVNILVTDLDNQPQDGINIVASSVNAQFVQNNTPSYPQFDEDAEKRFRKASIFNLLKKGMYSRGRLSSHWRQRLRLDTAHFYRVSKPGDSIYAMYFEVQTEDAQFSPFIFNKGELQEVYSIYVDGQLMAHSYNGLTRGQDPYSVLAREGAHTITVRTRDREVRFENIKLKKGYKLEFSIDFAFNQEGTTVKKVKTKLSRDEVKTVEANMVSIDHLPYYNENRGYMVQGGKIHELKSWYYRGRMVGPFKPNDTVHLETSELKHAFLFEPEYAYSFAFDRITNKPIGKPSRKLTKVKYPNLRLGQLCLTTDDLIARARFNNSYGIPPTSIHTETGNGSFTYQVQGDSSMYRTVLIKVRTNATDTIHVATPGRSWSRRYRQYLENPNNTVLNLPPGIYNGIFYTDHGYYFRVDSIEILADHINYRRFTEVDFQQVAAEKFAKVTTESYHLEYAKISNHIKGSVVYDVGGGPIEDAVVSILKAGRHYRGFTTRADGTFQFNLIPPGLYDFKFTFKDLNELYLLGVNVGEHAAPIIDVKLKHTLQGHDSIPQFPDSEYNMVLNNRNFKLTSAQPDLPADEIPSIRRSNSNLYSFLKYSSPNAYPYYKRHHTSGTKERLYTSSYSIDGSRIHFYRSRRGISGRRILRLFGIRPKARRYRLRGVSSGRRLRTRAKFGGEAKTAHANEQSAQYLLGDGDAYSGNGGRIEYFANGSLPEFRNFESDDFDVLDSLNLMADFRTFRGNNFDPSLKLNRNDAKIIRDNFIDYAYWQPNLYTNEKGQVSFDVTFPDNVTMWKSYALGIDKNKRSGIGFANTKSYKPLMGQLALPRFLIVGDTTQVIGKTLNYSKAPLTIHSQFKIEDQLVQENDATVEHALIENTTVIAGQSDTITVQYTTGIPSGYEDGERRSIPVFPRGVEESLGAFHVLEGDTTFVVENIAGAETMELVAVDNALDLMLDRIQKVKNYPHACMEQTASKLRVLLLEKQVLKTQGKVFLQEPMLRKMIGKLRKGQQEDAWWGWWPDSKPNLYMTIYVAEVLQEAAEAGYAVNFYDRTLDALQWKVGSLNKGDNIKVLNLLSMNGYDLDYPTYLKRFESASGLSEYSKLLLTSIKQRLDLGYDLNGIITDKHETIFGASYWGEHNYKWYDNSTQITLLAYKILAQEGKNPALLKSIRNYFLEKNSYTWRNTFENASILKVILPAILKEHQRKSQVPELELSGEVNRTVSEFPFRMQYRPSGNSLQVSYTGSTPLYFSTFTRKWNPDPKAKRDLFDIKTSFPGQVGNTVKLKAGELITMQVDLEVKKKGDYVVLEIPIPAGCTYNDKHKGDQWFEAHREYYKNKVLIFCETLPEGVFTFKLELQSRFSGTYTLNPAKVELMYFPTFYGRTQIRKVKIR